MSIPTIVCLCGNTRFKDAFLETNKQETLAGNYAIRNRKKVRYLETK